LKIFKKFFRFFLLPFFSLFRGNNKE